MRIFKAAVSALAILAVAGSASAQDNTVTLRSFDGFTQLRGEIIDFDGKTFSIRTGLGVIQVDALQVDCEGDACPDDLRFGAEFAIFGSNSIGTALMPALIEGYADQLEADLVEELGAVANERTLRIIHENGKEMAAIDLRAHGSGTAYAGLASGEAVIGMSSRRMRDEEAQLLSTNGAGDLRNSDFEHVVALDGLLVVTHPDNPLSAIGIEDLTDVFAGLITNWSELGGPNLPIVVHSLDEDTGTFDTFDSLVLSPLGEALTPRAIQFDNNVDLSDAVASTPGAIGFAGAAFARAAKVMGIEAECGLVSFPTTFGIKTEEYPLARRLYIYESPESGPAHSKELVEFALSEEAQGIVEDADFVSLREERMPLAQQGARLMNAIVEEEVSLPALRGMLTELRDAERLTTTFRFNQGSTELDARSARDAAALARAMVAGRYDGKELMLIGFTDSIGQFDLNQSLALRRAEQVRQRLEAIIGPRVA
ncbi:MAG: substrate-binding domain-containing protein, partial [Pseudomonadota bacterium]